MALYEYRATLVKVVDGDTIDVKVDLGFQIFHTMRLRLSGINSPELHAKDSAPGLAAKDYLRATLASSPALIIRTEKDKTEKYGRYLAEVDLANGQCVNQLMIDGGFAAPYGGGQR